jgi:membrane associated rhomboid family serine protease
MDYYGQRYTFGLGEGLTPAVKYLLLTNVACFFLMLAADEVIMRWFALTPYRVVHDFFIWQFVSYMFLHGGVMHILMNMLVLWMIGCELERYWGTKEFLRFYFICGIGAGLIHLLVSFLLPETPFVYPPRVAVIGASGAIYGLLMAFGVLFPNRIITLLLFFIIPINIKVKYLVTIAGLVVLYSSLAYAKEPGGNVAHFAHLGGMVIGFLYLKNLKPSLRWGEAMFSNPAMRGKADSGRLAKWFQQRTEKRRHMQVVRRRQQEVQLRERVDVILDKINEVGYENLSEDEKQILKKASQYLSQKNLHSEGLS